jgi:hypothetical protein
MNYESKTRGELIALCKERGIKGYSNKSKDALITLLGATGQDTGKFRTNMKDQFYTSPPVAEACMKDILVKCPQSRSLVWLEPSAGNGAFLSKVPEGCVKMGVDIDPKGPEILKGNFLEWQPTPGVEYILFGNPPFGRQASMAKKFITKGCKFASIIAFVLPRSFLKPSMTSAFDSKFHCVHSIEIPKDGFVINGEPYDVPCVFQIWEKRAQDRVKEEKVGAIGFTYVKSDEPHTLVIRRVGAFAGRTCKSGESFRAQSHYFVKLDKSIDAAALDLIIGKMNTHTFPSNTLGPRSLSKSEINIVLNTFI